LEHEYEDENKQKDENEGKEENPEKIVRRRMRTMKRRRNKIEGKGIGRR
jgi:hypothetical protein